MKNTTFTAMEEITVLDVFVNDQNHTGEWVETQTLKASVEEAGNWLLLSKGAEHVGGNVYMTEQDEYHVYKLADWVQRHLVS